MASNSSQHWQKQYALAQPIAEDLVWSREIQPSLKELPQKAREIWFYGFTEIFNNAIDHSEGKNIWVDVTHDDSTTQIVIRDDGIGIFNKLQRHMGLLDEQHALLELAKGKLTTDPERHSGQGIFFSSRLFDQFVIFSSGCAFSYQETDVENWVARQPVDQPGTIVMMQLENQTQRDIKAIFDEFSSSPDDGYGFVKTIVPVRLAQYGDEQLISRSQAKRLLARVERFQIVIFDFAGVNGVGQAFADEVFRVFAKRHPEIELKHINLSDAIAPMILRAIAAR